MATFYYNKRAKLHLCNRLLSCTEENYRKLKEKGKITPERIQVLSFLQKYRALTMDMLKELTGRSSEELAADLTSLMEYGLLVKQFYECMIEQESIRTETFYCASSSLPKEIREEGVKNSFLWSKDLPLADAMEILAFNQFHIALLKNVPKKAIQTQMSYRIKGVVVDGRYRLKGKKFHLGYSHLMVIAVRDFAPYNVQIETTLLRVKEAYAYGPEKMPWVILLCENKDQCANLFRKFRLDAELRELQIYFVLDTDIAYYENPLCALQTHRFANENKEVVSETFRISEWF